MRDTVCLQSSLNETIVSPGSWKKCYKCDIFFLHSGTWKPFYAPLLSYHILIQKVEKKRLFFIHVDQYLIPPPFPRPTLKPKHNRTVIRVFLAVLVYCPRDKPTAGTVQSQVPSLYKSVQYKLLRAESYISPLCCHGFSVLNKWISLQLRRGS